MTPQERVLLVVVPVAGTAFALGLGASLGWWAAVVAAGLMVAAALLLALVRYLRFRHAQAELRRQFEAGDTIRVAPSTRTGRPEPTPLREGRRPDPPREPPPSSTPPEPAPKPPAPGFERLAVADVPLPSAESDFRFLFSGTVCWQPGPHVSGVSHASPASLAADSVLTRAATLAATQSPADHLLVAHRVAATLGVVMADSTGQVLAWADNVSLAVLEDDAELLRKLSALRKQERLWRHERDFERHVRTYLSDEALRSTGSAVVWWLARHTDQVEQAVALLGTLAQLSAAASGSEVPEPFRHLVTPSPRLPAEQHRLSGLGTSPEVFLGRNGEGDLRSDHR